MIHSVRRFTLVSLLAAAALLVLIQLVPYGHRHNNPPVVREPSWDSETTRRLTKRACFDCHSNETIWPWYSNVAPVSWLVQHDIDEGRRELNFSDWRDGQREGEDPEELVEEVLERTMPPFSYRLLHSEARLSPAEIRRLASGLRQTAAP